MLGGGHLTVLTVAGLHLGGSVGMLAALTIGYLIEFCCK